jgi:hypothetical protein
MIRFIIKSFSLSALLTIAPVLAVADEVTDVINDVAAKLVQQLPMDKKIALKSLSPDETGLPEDFLRKLTSDIEAALLAASDFEINLANRLSIEDVWEEAVEFNNADFDELFKSANADIMLMMSPRAISKGVELAITAYTLTGENVGATLASSGSVLLQIDLKSNLGVDVNDLNQQMAQVLAEIESVGQTGGLISNPNTYAEYYHNARLLQQRGEIDLALANYERAIEEGYLFLDPVEDLVDLLIAKYGENAEAYIEKRLKPKLKPELFNYARWLVRPSNYGLTYENFTNESKPFIPLVALWLDQNLVSLVEGIREADASGTSNYELLFSFLEGARLIINNFENGDLQDFYIDKFRAKKTVSLNELRNLIEEFNRVEFGAFETDYQYGSGFKYIDASNVPDFHCIDEYVPFADIDWGDKDRCSFKRTDNMYGAAYGIQGTGIYSTIDFGRGSEMREALQPLIREDKINYRNINWQEIFPPVVLNENELNQLSDIPIVLPENGTAGPCGYIFDRKAQTTDGLKSLAPLKLTNLDTSGISSFQKNDDGEIVRVYSKPIFTSAYDRLWLADLCVDLFIKVNVENRLIGFKLGNNRQPNYRYYTGNEDELAKVKGIRSLLITDNVDTTKPVILTLGYPRYLGGGSSGYFVSNIDVTRDGSYIAEPGMPFESYWQNFPEPNQSYIISENGWFYIPSIVQSSVGIELPDVLSVSYHTKDGTKSVKNVFFADKAASEALSHGGYQPHTTGDSFPSYFCEDDKHICAQQFEDEWEQFLSENPDENINGKNILKDRYCDRVSCISGVGVEFLTSYSYIRANVMHDEDAYNFKINTKLCGVSNSNTRIVNVKNSTNLRGQAGLNGSVIGSVPLGATVSVVNPGSFLRYDRCAAACEGSNQAAINQCIDNNDVWIEVQYNGRRGFLSRKFLE